MNRSDTITVNEAIIEFIVHDKRKRRAWRQAWNRLERTAGERWRHLPITGVTRCEVNSVRDVLTRWETRLPNIVGEAPEAAQEAAS